MNNELSLDGLALIAGGHTAFQLLCAGVELGVFDLLSEKPKSSREQIAKAVGLDKQPAKILLTGLATLRLITKDGDAYENSNIVNQLIVSSSPTNMSEVLGWQKHIVYPGEMYFLESLKANTNLGLNHFKGDEDNLYARLSHDPFLEKTFHDAMSSLSNSANKFLASELDLSDISHLVDAGGGDGTNAINLAKLNPHLKLTVFDNPSVCQRAQENIDNESLSERIGTHEGDFFITDYPTDIDAIFFGHMMTIWSPEKDTAVLRKAYEALPKGGKVIIFNMMANDDGIGPMLVTLGSPYFLSIATGEGMMYSWSDYEKFLADAGFKQTFRQELPQNHGVLIGVK